MRGKVIGKGLPKIDSIAKATGEARYTVDLKLPGMLCGKILRSPIAHGKIKSIDPSRAERLEGVHAVITAKDVPQNRFSFFQWQADKTILCTDRVRYVGDEVAAVAAVDEETATSALDLIDVEYETLPAVFDAEEAVKPGAPLIHEKDKNIAFHVERLFGDPDRAFEECDFVCEDRYVTEQVAHCCMEVSNCVARWDPAGRLTIWVNTQAPHTQRQEVARILGIPARNVRIISSAMGGGFGSKLVMDMKLPIASLLSRRTGRPVKIENSRQEEFSTAKTRYGYTIYVKTGAKRDGRLWAREMKVVGDNGAYNDKGPATLNFSSMMFGTMYNIPNIRYEGTLVYTNKQMGTAFRGFGNPQITFACETQLDLLAEKMGMDPLELRLKNANQPGQVTSCGAEITSCGMTECMEAAARTARWKEKRNQKGLRGIGLANMVHTGAGGRFYGYNAADAFVKLSDDGTVTLITSALDMGQGAHTAMAQIVAEELGVNLGDVNVVSNDTDLTPYDLGAWGSRATFMNGNAALDAARQARQEIVQVAAEMMEADPEEIVLEDGKVSVKGSGERYSFRELADYAVNKRGTPISGRGRFVDRLPPGYTIAEAFAKNIPAFSFGTQVAEVEIDPETGEVKVLRVVAAHETGTTINTTMAEGQIEGSVVQGIGYALMERLVLEEGKVVNDGFLDYKIPTIGDIPEIKTILIETNDPHGPFGAKGIGEPGLVPTAAAIVNAIYDACGVRVRRLPVDRDDLLKRLREKRGGSRAAGA
ncbi:MAG: xanthine dehydrogenase family protein molybdopterin-binding subunit [Deltaproteobacteria bacterium]|nr:xanthine dehydrogenase family protein molybdopterin-binding subunit [Deltaproteobacteria bacterium]MBW2122933.1 xanthine dehydrogenase family protein molybdopterin-binding subunit [Deltaproteobacteria bacterium]